MRGARGPYLPAAAMVVMVIVGSWLLGDVSIVGIVHISYGNTLFFGLNFRPGLKLRQEGGHAF